MQMYRLSPLSVLLLVTVAAWMPVNAKTLTPAATGIVARIGITRFSDAALHTSARGSGADEVRLNAEFSRGIMAEQNQGLSGESREMPNETELMQRMRAHDKRLRESQGSALQAPTAAGITVGGSNFPVVNRPNTRDSLQELDRDRQDGGRMFGFDGLNNRDQAGANGFNVEPPDQALAIGNGQVLEAVNLALAVFNPGTGVQRFATASLNDFFQRPVSDFLSDPKAYFDTATGHFFVTVLDIDSSNRSFVLIAVSQTQDATGAYNIFALDTTNDGINGTPSDPNCPCLPDQPLIGADANGFFVSTNEFPLFTNGFNGANVYALDKQALANGNQAVNFQLFQPGPFTFSIQPATTPPNGNFETAQGGTEYFLSSLDFFGQFTNQIGVWTATNTSSLATNPNVSLQEIDIESQFYADPPPIVQKPGPLPQADALGNGITEEMVDSGDDRMQQVVFANGRLFAGLNTVVGVKVNLNPGGGTNDKNARAGIAFFVVKPSLDSQGVLSATLEQGGYVAVLKNSVVYPSIGVNPQGQGVMAFSLIGPSAFPSSAFIKFDQYGPSGAIRVAAQGAAPDDGFTGYAPFNGGINPGTGRWGDYSAAVADQDGNIWMGTEYIPDRPRLLRANWGTFINRVNP